MKWRYFFVSLSPSNQCEFYLTLKGPFEQTPKYTQELFCIPCDYQNINIATLRWSHCVTSV